MEKKISINDYKDIVGEEYIHQLFHLAEESKNKRVLMVNSTKTGGGVAEILYRLIPLINELGIECEWKVIEGDEDFFKITKSIHNDPPSTPVYSYHWINLILYANPYPRVIHGHDISALK